MASCCDIILKYILACIMCNSTAEAQGFALLMAETTGTTFLRCLAFPSRRWLTDGEEVSALVSLLPSDPGFYQCVGMVAGQPETANTGDPLTITYFHENCKSVRTDVYNGGWCVI